MTAHPAIGDPNRPVSSDPAATSSAGCPVRLVDLTKTYGAVRAVAGMSLSVDAGEFVTLLGPSGSGKTTTLTMLAGFTHPTSGEIYVDGKPVVDTPPHKRGIGMVFQNYALFPHKTVAQNIAFPLKMRRRPKAEIESAVTAALELVRLEGYGARYPNELSGGQQQRVALARATVFRPRLLLMDEPLGALDRKLRQTLQFELKEIQRTLGATVITVTHDQEEALTMSDRIVVMSDGEIAQVDTPEVVYRRPTSAFVADFVGETNLLEGTVVSSGTLGSTIRLSNQLELQTTKEVPPSGTVTIAVRPEHISVLPADSAVDSWEGTIVGVAYAGASIRYVIEANGCRLIARVDSTVASAIVQLGARVRLHLDPATVHVLPASGLTSADPAGIDPTLSRPDGHPSTTPTPGGY